MTTKNVADIVFCLDASTSMEPCFRGVCQHLGDFVQGLTSRGQQALDLRLDYVAYSASPSSRGFLFRHESLYSQALVESLYGSNSTGRFFTRDQNEFRQGLQRVTTMGDEAPLVALDFALDFPWRPAHECHRVVIMMTDEPAEEGVFLDEQLALLPSLIDKAARLRVLLHLVAPPSKTFDMLSALDKCEYDVLSDYGQGLAGLDFKEVLSYIGKSVSAASKQAASDHAVSRGLFRQAEWGTSTEQMRGS